MSFIHILLAFIFLVQSSAWAIGEVTLEKKAILETIVARYNSMSSLDGHAEFKKIMKSRPKVDQSFINKNFLKGDHISLPKLKLVNDSFVFNHDNKDYSFEILNSSMIKVNGEVIDLASGKLSESSGKLETTLMQKSSSIINFFISSAHAEITASGTLKIAGILIMILSVLCLNIFVTILGGVLYLTGDALKTGKEKKTFNEYLDVNGTCLQIKNRIEELKMLNDIVSLNRIKSTLRVARDKVKADSYCKKPDSPYLDHLCKETVECTEKVLVELNTPPKAENQSSRGEMKSGQGKRKRQLSTDKQASPQ